MASQMCFYRRSHSFSSSVTQILYGALVFLALVPSGAESGESPHKQGEVIVQLVPGVRPEELITRHQGISLTSSHLLVRRLNIWLFRYDNAAVSPDSAVRVLRRDERVRIAQRNHVVTRRDIIPNDPSFGNQWALQNTGQSGGLPDADIDAPEAWDFATGGVTALGDSIVVAVIDGGVDLNHEDLLLFKNRHEIPNNGIDDDQNGYVDDYHGWNAYNSNGNIPVDGHGTHVAGIVAARGNNGIGVSGVNWNARVMPIAGASGLESTVVEAYGYALEMRMRYNESRGDSGAFVVATNSSFGVDFGQPVNFPIWCAMYNAMGEAGILSCGATANLNINVDLVGDIPTACPSPWLVSVTNTTRNDTRNGGAAYGATTIDLGSPGTDVLSTLPGNGYGALTGTSMATPGVAGVIALMYAAAPVGLVQMYRSDPAGVSQMFKDWLLQGTDSIPALAGITVTGGRVNAFNSLQNVRSFGNPQDPSAPSDVRAFSDYSTPSSILLRWKNPTTLFGGGPITSFVTQVYRDSVLVTERPEADTSFVDTGLSDGSRYQYTLRTRLLSNNNQSQLATASWYAGGAPSPNPPSDLRINFGPSGSYVLHWSNPRTQIDGTVLDDFAGIRVYRNGVSIATLIRGTADTARVDSTFDSPGPGVHSYVVRAIDNETPINESLPGNTVYSPLAIPFEEPFTTSGMPRAGVWVATNVNVNTLGIDPPSSPYALNLNGVPTVNGDRIESFPFDLSGKEGRGIVLGYLYQPRGTGDNPEVSDSLIVELQNDLGEWVTARRYPGLAANAPTPSFRSEMIELDSTASSGTLFHDAFKFRFRSRASGSGADDWFLDDVFLGVPSLSPVAQISSQSVSDTVLAGTADSISYSFAIRNVRSFSRPLQYVIDVIPPVSWLRVTPDSGGVIAGAAATINLGVAFPGDSTGVFETLVLVHTNDSIRTPDSVLVSFVVNPAPAISIYPGNISFVVPGGDSASASLTIRNDGPGILSYETRVEAGYIDSLVTEGGNTSSSTLSFGASLRGIVVAPTSSVRVLEVRSMLELSVMRDLRFVLYEGDAAVGTFRRVVEVVLPGVGPGQGMYSSGPLDVRLEAGKYYAIGTAWSGSGVRYFWQTNAPVPVATGFGSIVGGLALGSYPPPATITQAANANLSFTTVTTATTRWLEVSGGGEGTVNPGDTTTVSLKARSGLLSSGLRNGSLTILSNDPVAGAQSVPVTLDLVTSATEPDESLPSTYTLLQNYPNPFNHETILQFHLPTASNVSLRVFDILGRLVTTLVQREFKPGVHTIQWDGTDGSGRTASTGVYYVRIEASGKADLFSQTRKMLLLR